MVFAPQDLYDAMNHEKTRNQNECVVKSEDKLHDIIGDPKFTTDYKMKLFNQELKKTIDTNPKVENKSSEKKDTSECHYHNSNMIEKELIQSLSRSLQVKGKLQLQRLKASNISWNSAGELIILSAKYDGTKIIDLVNDVI